MTVSETRDLSVSMVFKEEHEVRFLLISGKQLGEPVAWYGPIVMNTREELETAFKEYKARQLNGISIFSLDMVRHKRYTYKKRRKSHAYQKSESKHCC